jgi:hypothetical protein
MRIGREQRMMSLRSNLRNGTTGIENEICEKEFKKSKKGQIISAASNPRQQRNINYNNHVPKK